MSKKKTQTKKSKTERTDKFVWLEGDFVIVKPGKDDNKD